MIDTQKESHQCSKALLDVVEERMKPFDDFKDLDKKKNDFVALKLLTS